MVQQVVRDLSNARAADDRTFAIYSKQYDYEPFDLDSRVESVDDSSERWRIEKVSFTAAYGGERIPARVFLPKNAKPPYQTVVYFPPASALNLPSIDRVGERDFGYLVRSGRAVLFPVYYQTYQRRRKPGRSGAELQPARSSRGEPSTCGAPSTTSRAGPSSTASGSRSTASAWVRRRA